MEKIHANMHVFMYVLKHVKMHVFMLSEIQRFERSDTIEIHHGIIFEGLPHIF